MADDGPQAFEIQGSWVGVEELPMQFANAFAGSVGPNAIFLNLGSFAPPNIGGTPEEVDAQVRALTFLPIKPITRIALAPQGLDELITLLENTRQNYQNLRKVIDQEGP